MATGDDEDEGVTIGDGGGSGGGSGSIRGSVGSDGDAQDSAGMCAMNRGDE